MTAKGIRRSKKSTNFTLSQSIEVVSGLTLKDSHRQSVVIKFIPGQKVKTKTAITKTENKKRIFDTH